MWVILSIFGALFQAIEMAIQKKALQVKGLKAFIGFLTFTFAGILFGLILYFQTGSIWPENSLSFRFWNGMFWSVSLNVLAAYFLYKALEIADLNYIMPFMALTSLSIIVPPIFIFHEIPSFMSFIGIFLIAASVLVMDYKPKQTMQAAEDIQRRKNNLRGKLYFLVTAACFTITPATMKMAIVESSPLFTSFIVHLLIGISFIALIVIFREQKRIKQIFNEGKSKNFLFTLLLAGLAIAIANLSINFAYVQTKVAYVMGIKRLMPLFAFGIGYLYFKERSNAKRKLLATIAIVAGAVLLVIFQ